MSDDTTKAAKQAAQVAVQAAGVASKGLQLKIAAVGAVLLLIGLLLIGIMAPNATQSAAAASCENSGIGTGSTLPVTSGGTSGAAGSTSGQQIANAKAIDAVAQADGLPGRATLIALMTALQESSLLNLDHGDADSLGLYQQRPSMGWGTKAQIMDIGYATQSFLEGRGGNKGLTQIPNWATLPLGQAAQDVQHSLYPTLYAGQESLARQIAAQAGINVDRPGTSTTTNSGTSAPVTSANTGCGGPPTVTSAPGSAFTDGVATWTVTNPRSVDQAIAWALAHSGDGSTSGWYDQCLAFTATVYGWHYSGVDTALLQWAAVPAYERHPGDRHPPPGALLYWTTGNPAGHIAVYLGGGKAASTDILRVGYVDVVDASQIEALWGAHYLGWSAPDFPHGG